MATTESRDFTIALCGFSDNEQKALDRAFMLSKVRPRHYLRWQEGRQRPDICIVNEDLPAGPRDWMELRGRLAGALLPVIRVGFAEQATALFDGALNVFFKRPVLANRILKTLDDLVTDAYQFAPELAIHDAMAAPTQSERAQPQEPAHSAKRIMVVDDSESVRTMMEMQLTKAGYAVDFAASGEESLRKALEQSYDLIFLDIMLPGINGYEVVRVLKRNMRVKTPVVMLTGKSSRLDKLRGKLSAADAYLTKPLAIADLNATLQRYLS